MKAKFVKESFEQPNGIDIVKGYSGLSVSNLWNLQSMFEFSVEPSRKEEIKAVIKIKDLDEIISKLPEVIFKRYYRTPKEYGLLSVWPEDFPFEYPFIAHVDEDEQTYIVDPNGSKYAKYIAKLV